MSIQHPVRFRKGLMARRSPNKLFAAILVAAIIGVIFIAMMRDETVVSSTAVTVDSRSRTM